MNILLEQGVCKFERDFLSLREADLLFDELMHKVVWRSEAIRMFGKSVCVPRLISWYGDEGLDYVYSGNHHCANGWPDFLMPLKEKLEGHIGRQINFVLCNLYRDGSDYMGWHDDGEKGMGDSPIVASLSLGQERRFDLKHKFKPLDMSVSLSHGSLLLMTGKEIQCYWKHRLPKDKSVLESRINLTFRNIS